MVPMFSFFSTGRIQRLAETRFENRQPILDSSRLLKQSTFALIAVHNTYGICVARSASESPDNWKIWSLGYRRRPFSKFGLVILNPFYVTVCRSSEKRWAFLFICMITCAIHIQKVPSMVTGSCDMGFQRFIAHRCMPCVSCWPAPLLEISLHETNYLYFF